MALAGPLFKTLSVSPLYARCIDIAVLFFSWWYFLPLPKDTFCLHLLWCSWAFLHLLFSGCVQLVFACIICRSFRRNHGRWNNGLACVSFLGMGIFCLERGSNCFRWRFLFKF
ncbi:hypothetical protein P154DRAFT_333156 [Amniculicola lignicola CBS 123094]|uniref:Uncharacterized protein n=1 Tax=Amniculicola lignicola CBS 123094 TaxID=1392246 RepID=A0A6A5W6T9_9PLEO|nr:hypothetical protein P154DRAFT_333156 [Amniculicola lignicola CBS 123094]